MKNSVEKASTSKNYIYNLLFQIVSIIAPLITTPYLSRVLQNNGIGQISFTLSIVTYFTLAAALGFSIYAQREVARCKNDKFKQTKIFFEVLILKAISVSVCLFVYFLTIILKLYKSSYEVLLWILSINVVAVLFDVTFFFQGNEEFKFIAIRNIIIKVASVVLIFVLVKKQSDVWIYVLLTSLALIISNLSLWVKLPKYLTKISRRDINIARHIGPTFRLFLPTLAISVYTIVDKTLIGVLVPGEIIEYQNGELIRKSIADIENGYYHQAEQLIKMALTVITALGTVIVPRNSQLIAEGRREEFENNIRKSLRFTLFLGIPIMCGLIAISFIFSGWFYGDGYEKVPYLIIILSPLILIIGLSNIFGLQCLLPLKKDGQYTIAICVGAIVNLALNFALIPFLYSYGASIATIIAELFVTLYMYFAVKRQKVDLNEGVKGVWKYALSGVLMIVVLVLFQIYLTSTVFNTLFMIGFGALFYLIMMYLLNDEFVKILFSKIIRSIFKYKESNTNK